MSQKSKTARMIEYGELSKDFDFRDDIECALESNYSENPDLYDLQLINHVACVLRLAPESTPEEILDQIRNFRNRSSQK